MARSRPVISALQWTRLFAETSVSVRRHTTLSMRSFNSLAAERRSSAVDFIFNHACSEQRYESRDLLGSGTFANVWSGEDVFVQRPVAIKCQPSSQSAMSEVLLQRRVSHPNVQSIEAAFVVPAKEPGSDDRLRMVTQLFDIDLFDHLFGPEARATRLPEAVAARCFRHILRGLEACHEEGVAHLDVKLENILLSFTGPKQESFRAVLADFGAAHCLKSAERPSELVEIERPVGSTSYVAPEVLQGRCFCANSDAWSAGILLYCLLLHDSPWLGAKGKEIELELLHGKLPPGLHGCRGRLGDEAYDLLTQLLEPDHTLRCSVGEALKHPWIERHSAHDDQSTIVPQRGSVNPVSEVLPRHTPLTDYRTVTT